jgi:hypothetical protein
MPPRLLFPALLLPALLGAAVSCSLGADQLAAAADVEVLKRLLAAAAAAEDAGTRREALHKDLAALADRIGDPKLRDRTKDFLPELERAAAGNASAE